MAQIDERITIRLTGADRVELNYLYDERERQTKEMGARDTFISDYTPNASFTGLVAEFAFAKWFGVDYTIKPYDPTNDDVLGYQIKATERYNGCLIKQPHNPPGIYVLGIVLNDFTEVSFRGWKDSSEIQRWCYWRADVPKPGYFVPQAALWALEDLPETSELFTHRTTGVW
jgi:hypothetical protein